MSKRSFICIYSHSQCSHYCLTLPPVSRWWHQIHIGVWTLLHWNHPETILTLSSPANPHTWKNCLPHTQKKIPCAKNVGDHWSIGLTRLPSGPWLKWGIMNLLPTSSKHQDPALQNMPFPWEKVIPKEEGMLCTLGRVRNPTREGINGIDLMEHPLHVTYFFFIFNFLFTYFWLHRVFIAACQLFSSCGQQGPLSRWGSHWGSFPCFGAWVLGCLGFSSCGLRAQSPCGIWNLFGQRSNLCPQHWQVDS